MKASGPDHDGRVLARIEAEFRESDPQFSALFDRLTEAGHGPRPLERAEKTHWAGLIAALLPVLALVLIATLTGARSAGWQGCPALPGCPGITAFADRAVATVLAHTAHLGREVRAEVCHSIPIKQASRCG